MDDSDEHRGKLKEDITIRDEELGNLRQELFDFKKQHEEELRIREAQVTQFSFGREFMRNE